MNGDIGIIQDFLFTNGEINGLIVKFDSGLVNYVNDELEDLKLAYAISIHKSQGSEFDIVILPLSPSYSFMFKRKLIYTAITRAKKMLILIGDANSLQRGIGLIEAQRFTILKELINDNLSSKIHKINDQSSAFNYLGEEETLLSPYDFETKPKKETKIEKSLGEIEFDLEDF
jgi:exodeoxyribonuclease V alpha subunit